MNNEHEIFILFDEGFTISGVDNVFATYDK